MPPQLERGGRGFGNKEGVGVQDGDTVWVKRGVEVGGVGSPVDGAVTTVEGAQGGGAGGDGCSSLAEATARMHIADPHEKGGDDEKGPENLLSGGDGEEKQDWSQVCLGSRSIELVCRPRAKNTHCLPNGCEQRARGSCVCSNVLLDLSSVVKSGEIWTRNKLIAVSGALPPPVCETNLMLASSGGRRRLAFDVSCVRVRLSAPHARSRSLLTSSNARVASCQSWTH